MTVDEPDDTNGAASDRPELPHHGPDAELLRNSIARRLFGVESRAVAIGRFEVVESIGSGSMGLVYLAKDPQLGRHVALKLLHPRAETNALERLRSLREAQALAKVSHPNVVAIHEVGEHDGRVFLAMEYVEGSSLRQWQQHSAHGWREIVEVYLQAGRGLAAVHAAGLVHRDFKPANVLIGVDGRVRVADFGLALGAGLAAGTGPSAERSGESGAGSPSEGLGTRTGQVVGTRAYMSPEQRRGRTIGASSDQYSFCVALWEALFGHRPGDEEDGSDGSSSARETPRSGASLRRVRGVLRRGLSVEPEERWPDMTALLAALDEARQERKWGPLGLALLVALGTGGGMLATMEGEDARCLRLSELSPTWDDEQALAIREGALGLGLGESSGPRLGETMAGVFEAHAREWAEAAGRTCERSKAGEDVSRVVECLEASSRRSSIATEVAATDPEVLLAASEIEGLLVSPAVCEQSAEVVLSDPLEDLDDATILALLRSRLLATTGRYDEAAAAYERLATDASEPAGTLGVQVALGTSFVHLQRGALQEARVSYEQAVEGSLQVGNPALTALGLAGLAKTLVELEAGSEAWWTARQCRAMAPDESMLEASCANVLAQALALQGRPDALGMLDDALMLATRLLGPEHPEVSHLESVHANFLAESGRKDLAREIYERERDRQALRFGEAHPEVLILEYDLALLDREQEQLDAAADRLSRVVPGLRGAWGTSAKLSGPLVLAAEVAAARGDADAATAFALEAAEVQQRLPLEHSQRGAGLTVAAYIALAATDFPRALELYQALAAVYGVGVTGERSLVWLNVAWLRCVLHGCRGAADAMSRVDRVSVAGSELDVRLYADNVYGMLALSEGDPTYARNFAERVLRGLQRHDGPPLDEEIARAFEAEARWILARAAWADPSTRALALAEARRALGLVHDDLLQMAALNSIDPELALEATSKQENRRKSATDSTPRSTQ